MDSYIHKLLLFNRKRNLNADKYAHKAADIFPASTMNPGPSHTFPAVAMPIFHPLIRNQSAEGTTAR